MNVVADAHFGRPHISVRVNGDRYSDAICLIDSDGFPIGVFFLLLIFHWHIAVFDTTEISFGPKKTFEFWVFLN